jgi:hypothetical protein
LRARDRAIRQNDPARKAAGHERGISRCLMQLMPRIRVIDRSEPAPGGSGQVP